MQIYSKEILLKVLARARASLNAFTSEITINILSVCVFNAGISIYCVFVFLHSNKCVYTQAQKKMPDRAKALGERKMNKLSFVGVRLCEGWVGGSHTEDDAMHRALRNGKYTR